MKRFLGIVCTVLSGYASAQIAHPEDSDIVGIVDGSVVCFNNDGNIVSTNECDTTAVDEGFVSQTFGFWNAGGFSGIKACGVSAVDPVLDATCPLIFTLEFDACTPNGYVLVQTTKSDHFFAVKANADCTGIAAPETTGLVPCLTSDPFDPVNGCTRINPTPPQISVDDGFIKLDSYTAPPPPAYCADDTHDGRMVVDSLNSRLYVCTQSGWTAFDPAP